MNKLLAANFSRMLKNEMFWMGIIFMVGMGILLPVSHYRSMMEDGYTMKIDNGFFAGAVYIGTAMSIFCSLFVGTEYSDGTIRNKIVAGQKRTVIYLSNLITCVVAGGLMCAASFLTYLCVGLPLLGTFEGESKTVVLLVLCVFILSAAYSAIFTLVAMLNQNKAIVAVICILSAFVLMFSGTYITSRLNEPEMRDSYTYMDDTGNIVIDEAQPNPYYIGGTKREVYEALLDFLPGGQSIQIANQSAEKPWLLMLYSGIIIAGATGAGLLLFRKKDLK